MYYRRLLKNCSQMQMFHVKTAFKNVQPITFCNQILTAIQSSYLPKRAFRHSDVKYVSEGISKSTVRKLGEQYSHRKAQVARDLNDYLVPVPLLWTGLSPIRSETRAYPMPPATGHPRSGQPVPVTHHLRTEKFPPNISSESSFFFFFYLKPFPFVLALSDHVESQHPSCS